VSLDNFYIIKKVANVTTTITGPAFLIDINDILHFKLVKSGTNVYAEVYKNGDESNIVSISTTADFNGVSGYLSMNVTPNNLLDYIKSLSITTTEHAHHSDVSELANQLDKHIITSDGYIRANTARNRRYYHLPVQKLNPGASGAVWTTPSSNTMGGWQVDAASEVLYLETDIHNDWDGASDMTIEIYFEKNTAGGTAGDTVDLKLQVFYKGVGDSACKTQAIAESVTVVGDDAQYTQYEAIFTINWDETDNVVQAGDGFGFILNLETDTSECDNIIINRGGYYYNTTHTTIESGDI